MMRPRAACVVKVRVLPNEISHGHVYTLKNYAQLFLSLRERLGEGILKLYNSSHRNQARHMRANPTAAEKVLWQQLRNRQVNNLKFRRQHPVGSYIVDFYCAEKKLLVEIDGDSHLEQVEYDIERTQWLESQGMRVLRFTNEEVLGSPVGAVAAILDFCEGKSGPLT